MILERVKPVWFVFCFFSHISSSKQFRHKALVKSDILIHDTAMIVLAYFKLIP